MSETAAPWQQHASADVKAGGTLDVTRASLRAVPKGPTEMEQYRHDILEFVDEHPDALHRSCLSGHLTGSAVILDHTRTKVAMLFHTKLQRWLQPGGHADGEGNIAAVALREAAEETGMKDLTIVTPAVDIDVHHIPERGNEPEHSHLDVRYLLLAPEGGELTGNHESQALQWVDPADLPDMGVDDGLIRMVDRAFDAAGELDIA